MNNEELIALNNSLIKAAKAAKEFENFGNDGGSCNLDFPAIKIDIRKNEIAKLDYKLGYKLNTKLWKGWRPIEIPLEGMASRRTRMAEAAVKSMKEDGYDVRVYYQLD